MRLRRDAYRDYLTCADVANAPREASARSIEGRLIDRLWRRSGAINVINGRLRKDHRFDTDAVQYRISFDSRAWTGRP